MTTMDSLSETRFDAVASFLPVKSWCIETALPYWAEVGFDRPASAFHERLEFSGRPDLSAPRRTMVQGRQIYVFAQAAMLGWFPDGATLARRAADNMIRVHWSPDDQPGWVFSVHLDGTIADARRDAYAHAFALYGLAWAYKITPEPQYRSVADATFAFLGDRLSPGLSLQPDDRLHRQNPYMHLFEAALAWYDATGDGIYLERADKIFLLFATKFFQAHSAILLECLDEEWLPVEGSKGRSFEPGHHFEWVWLLQTYAGHSKRFVKRYSDSLFRSALERGFVDDLIMKEVRDDSTIVNGELRIWPYTEAIKAAAVEHEAGRNSMDGFAGRLMQTLQRRFLARPFAAGWLDHFSADGSIKVNFVPASTLYHIVMALAEADRVFNVTEHDRI